MSEEQKDEKVDQIFDSLFEMVVNDIKDDIKENQRIGVGERVTYDTAELMTRIILCAETKKIRELLESWNHPYGLQVHNTGS